MKIFLNDSVYVQKNDIGYLSHTDRAIPASIYTKVFSSGITIINDSNRYEFVKFSEPSEIEFFEQLDLIVNYDDYKDLSKEEIIDAGNKINEERNNIAEIFNAMSDEEKERNMNLYTKCDELEFKVLSIRDILWYKEGHLKLKMPRKRNKVLNFKKSNK